MHLGQITAPTRREKGDELLSGHHIIRVDLEGSIEEFSYAVRITLVGCDVNRVGVAQHWFVIERGGGLQIRFSFDKSGLHARDLGVGSRAYVSAAAAVHSNPFVVDATSQARD